MTHLPVDYRLYQMGFRPKAADNTLKVRTFHKAVYKVTSAPRPEPRPQTGGTGRQIIGKALHAPDFARVRPAPRTRGATPIIAVTPHQTGQIQYE